MREVFDIREMNMPDLSCKVCAVPTTYWVTMYARAGIQMFNLPCGHPWDAAMPPLTDKERAALALRILKEET